MIIAFAKQVAKLCLNGDESVGVIRFFIIFIF